MLNHGSENEDTGHKINLVYAKQETIDCTDQANGIIIVDLTSIFNHFLLVTKIDTIYPKEVTETLFRFLMEYVSVWSGEFDYDIDNMNDEFCTFISLDNSIFTAEICEAFYQKENWIIKNASTVLRICKMYEDKLKEGVMCYSTLFVPYCWETTYDLTEMCLLTFFRLAEPRNTYDGP